MILWIDAQISPTIAPWIKQNFAIEAVALRDIGLRDAEDADIFQAAKSAGAVVMTKDSDFSLLLDRLGAPPQIIWVTYGNTFKCAPERDTVCRYAGGHQSAGLW